jgi:CRP-like cAMP-binding protein
MQTVPDLSLLFRRVELRRQLSEMDKAALQQAVDRTFVVSAREEIAREGATLSSSTLLLSGFAARSHMTEAGTQQITALHIPGDFIDLHSFPLKVMDHTVVAITECTLATFPHSALEQIVASRPNLTMALWLLTTLDAAIHREWLVSMGATSSDAHMAHLFCEIFMRLRAVGLTCGNKFPFPMTQHQLAASLGISDVHVNRVLQELRGRSLIRFDGKEAVILDWPALVRLGQFDPMHLHLPGNDVLREFGPG